MKHKLLSVALSLVCGSLAISQNANLGEIHGNIQVDAQYYNPDSAIDAPAVPEKMLMNGFSNIIYTNKNFTAGVRYETYLNAMQGFPVGYVGTGIPYRYATYKADELEATVGNFYDQFGNGLVFRCYEERSLGLDNAMDGVRLKYTPVTGLTLKGVIGKQRLYFDKGPGIVRGFDGELMVNDVFKKFADKKTRLSLGGSFVSKFQTTSPSDKLIYPKNVGASAGRVNITSGNITINGEYATKINDPSADNGFIYKEGQALLLMATYAKKGFALSINGKRMDNMNFRSDRGAAVNDLLINYSPALCRQHTYNLMAFYPYVAQPNGEIAYQAELSYKFKKETKIGGPYGMDFSINYSGANSLDTVNLGVEDSISHLGYKSEFLALGKKVYFRDLVFELTRKFSKKVKATVMYSYQVFNISQVQGKAGAPLILSNIAVADVTYKFKSDRAIRVEIEHLSTKQDMKSWAMLLAELTLGSHWYVACQDLYNYGNEDSKKRIHYYNATVGYNKNANRISLSYGKQRAGIFCVGAFAGLCRHLTG